MKVTGPKYKTIIMLRYKSSINYKVSAHYGVPQAHFMSLKKKKVIGIVNLFAGIFLFLMYFSFTSSVFRCCDMTGVTIICYATLGTIAAACCN